MLIAYLTCHGHTPHWLLIAQSLKLHEIDEISDNKIVSHWCHRPGHQSWRMTRLPLQIIHGVTIQTTKPRLLSLSTKATVCDANINTREWIWSAFKHTGGPRTYHEENSCVPLTPCKINWKFPNWLVTNTVSLMSFCRFILGRWCSVVVSLRWVESETSPMHFLFRTGIEKE